jgi:hypothetical protein
MNRNKNVKAIFGLLIFAGIFGCFSKQQVTSNLTEIDVSRDYPEKVIKLSDIADITYIQLNTDDDYLFGNRPVSITKNTIVIFERIYGSFLFFSKDGAPKSKFNRKGNGPGEYIEITCAIYDEEKDEIFSVFRNKIAVYSSSGEYKRTLTLPNEIWISEIALFDENSLLIYDSHKQYSMAFNKIKETDSDKNVQQNDQESPFIRISKKEGDLIERVPVPQDDKIELITTFNADNGAILSVPGKANRIVKCRDGFLLRNPETDTIFFYNKDLTLTPAMIQTPSVKSLTPMVYINNYIDTEQYQFIEIITMRLENRRLPSTFLVRDKETGIICKPKIIVDDFKGKEISIAPSITVCTGESQTGFFELDLTELKTAYNENSLSGKLKEIVVSANDDDNNIYLLLNFR